MLFLHQPPKPLFFKKKSERPILCTYFTERSWAVLPRTACRKPGEHDNVCQGCSENHSSTYKKKEFHDSFCNRNLWIRCLILFMFFLIRTFYISQTFQHGFNKHCKYIRIWVHLTICNTCWNHSFLCLLTRKKKGLEIHSTWKNS